MITIDGADAVGGVLSTVTVPLVTVETVLVCARAVLEKIETNITKVTALKNFFPIGAPWLAAERGYLIFINNYMISQERYCLDCGHRCHCYAPMCCVEVGVGMSDKTQPCGCKKCNCGARPMFSETKKTYSVYDLDKIYDWG